MSDLCLKLSTDDMWHIKNKVELIDNGNKAYSLISNGMKVGRISIPNGITDVQFIPETNNLMFTYLNELGEYDKIEINVDSIVNLNMDMESLILSRCICWAAISRCMAGKLKFTNCGGGCF